MQGLLTEMPLLSLPRPHPIQPTKRKKKKRKQLETIWQRVRPIKALTPFLKSANPALSITRLSRSFHRAQKFCSTEQFCGEEDKWVPMNNQSTTSYPRRHIRQKQYIAQMMHRVTPHVHHCYRSCTDIMYITATDRLWARLHSNTPPKKKHSWSVRCAAVEHHTFVQYPKTAGQNSRKIKPLVTNHDQSYLPGRQVFHDWMAHQQSNSSCQHNRKLVLQYE